MLNPKLIMPPKCAKLSPNLRKKKGRPTAKRIELLKALQADARPFVDKASFHGRDGYRLAILWMNGRFHGEDVSICVD